jgi:hypothetical protein
MTSSETIGLGWRIHSSSAVLVAVSGPVSSPVVVRREQVALIADPAVQEPYHAAVGRPLDEAEALISSVAAAAASAAESTIRGLVTVLGSVSCVGVVGGDRPVRADLGRILSKHALLHASERDLYERAIIEGATRAGLPVTTIPAKGKDTVDHASEMLGLDLSPALAMAGKTAGSPWQKDHREATAAALVALSALS